MPAYSRPPYPQILQNLIGTVAVRCGLTDVADSSAIKYLCAAFARVVDEIYFQIDNQRLSWDLQTSQGADLDNRAQELTAGTIVRAAAVQAQGSVVFYTLAPGASVTVAQGTAVTTADGTQTFVTTAPATIAPTNPPVIAGHAVGQDSAQTPVVAQTPGAVGNVPALSLTALGRKPVGVDGVINTAATAFGADTESDDSLTQRIRLYPATLARSTIQALEGSVLGAMDPTSAAIIRFSKIVEDPTRLGFSTLYVDDGSGNAERDGPQVSSENLCAALLGAKVVAGGKTYATAQGGEARLNLINYPVKGSEAVVLTSNRRGVLTVNSDYRLNFANGLVTFTPPLVAGDYILASYTYYVGLLALAQKIVDGDPQNPAKYPGYRAAGTQVIVATPQIVLQTVNASLSIDPAYDPDQVRAAVSAAMSTYINTQSIGRNVLTASLIAAAKSVAGVSNIALSVPGADVVVQSSQLARINPSSIYLA
jgi:uncharacterized phage protein gp47/JayE